MDKKTSQKFKYLLFKPKQKIKQKYWRRSTLTESEILEYRKLFNITPKSPNDRHGYKK